MSRAWSQLPALLQGHVTLTLIALAVGTLVSVPLGLFLTRHARLRGPALTVAGVVQTVPSLALLALMVPVLEAAGEAGLASVAEAAGLAYSAFGFLPAILALTLYSVLPILRNTVTGVAGVDPAVTEAARGMGMTDFQSLLRVELPLSMPVILAGVRTSAVWTVGIATLATPVGQECLGNYIFSGLQTRNNAVLLFGVFWAAALALIIDGLLGQVQRGLEGRQSVRSMVAGGLLVAVFVVGATLPWAVGLVGGGGDAERSHGGTAEAARLEAIETLGPIRIGAKNFNEQYILAAAMENQLREAGFETTLRDSLGSTVVFKQLAAGELDVYIDYTGTVWANHMQRTEPRSADAVFESMSYWLAQTHGIRCLGRVGFENAYAFAMPRAEAERLGIRSLADLALHAETLTLGGDLEWFDRPEWPAVRDAYGLDALGQRSFGPTLMYDALRSGQVDLLAAFSSDGRIAGDDLVVLADPKGALPPYDAVVLLGPRVAGVEAVADVLWPMVGRIDLESMQRINAMVDVEKRAVEEAAREVRQLWKPQVP